MTPTPISSKPDAFLKRPFVSARSFRDGPTWGFEDAEGRLGTKNQKCTLESTLQTAVELQAFFALRAVCLRAVQMLFGCNW